MGDMTNTDGLEPYTTTRYVRVNRTPVPPNVHLERPAMISALVRVDFDPRLASESPFAANETIRELDDLYEWADVIESALEDDEDRRLFGGVVRSIVVDKFTSTDTVDARVELDADLRRHFSVIEYRGGAR